MNIYQMTPVKRNEEGLWRFCGAPIFFASLEAILRSKVINIKINERGEEIKSIDQLQEGMVYLRKYTADDVAFYKMLGFETETEPEKGYILHEVKVYE